MTHKEFKALLERRLNLVKSTLDSKSKEYATDSDKLHNFKRAAEMNREHPAQSAHGMLTKHLISYMDMVDGISAGKVYYKSQLDEKFGDIINYFILQEAIFSENLD